MRIKICSKEAQESFCWLKILVRTNDMAHASAGEKLIDESDESRKIFSSIIEKST